MIDFKKLRDLIIEKKCIASNDYGKDDPFVGIYWEDLVEIIKQCDTTKWISVEEALPEDTELYFVAYKAMDGVLYSTGCYEAKFKEWYVDGYGYNADVTHWMPIPSLKGGEK